MPKGLPPALRAVADRIYHRDPARFRKLVVWIATARCNRWSDDRIRKVLLALDKREAAGQQIETWWPWCQAALKKVRTQELEAAGQAYKHDDLNSVRAILGQIFRAAERRNHARQRSTGRTSDGHSL